VAPRGDLRRGPGQGGRAVPEVGIAGLHRGPAADQEVAGPAGPGLLFRRDRGADGRPARAAPLAQGHRVPDHEAADQGSQQGNDIRGNGNGYYSKRREAVTPSLSTAVE
jgi:hypothetical protein